MVSILNGTPKCIQTKIFKAIQKQTSALILTDRNQYSTYSAIKQPPIKRYVETPESFLVKMIPYLGLAQESKKIVPIQPIVKLFSDPNMGVSEIAALMDEEELYEENLNLSAKNESKGILQKTIIVRKVQHYLTENHYYSKITFYKKEIEILAQNLLKKDYCIPVESIYITPMQEYNPLILALIEALTNIQIHNVPVIIGFFILKNKQQSNVKKIFQNDYQNKEKLLKYLMEKSFPFRNIWTHQNEDSPLLSLIDRRNQTYSKRIDGLALYDCTTLQQEIAIITDDIKRKLKAGIKPSDISIQYPAKENLEFIQKEFLNCGIETHVECSFSETALCKTIRMILNDEAITGENLSAFAAAPFSELSQNESKIINDFFTEFGLSQPVEQLLSNCPTDSVAKKIIQHALSSIKEKKFPIRPIETIHTKISILINILSKFQFHVITEKSQKFFLINTWKCLKRILNEMNTAVGSMTVSNQQFSDALLEMCNYYHVKFIPDVNSIPITASAVYGKYLYVLHANDGFFPKISDYGIPFSERKLLNLPQENEIFYQKDKEILLTLWESKNIVITFTGKAGHEKPALYTTKLKALFPMNCSEQSFVSSEEFFFSLLEKLQIYRNTGFMSPNLQAQYFAVISDPIYKCRLSRVLQNFAIDKKQFSIPIPKAKTAFAVTELESYNRCPFAYFASHILHLYPPKTDEETPLDEGIFYHNVFEKFFQDKNIPQDLSSCLIKLQPILKEQEQIHRNGILLRKEMQFEKNRIEKRIQMAIWMACQQLNKGNFHVEYVEYPISEKINVKGTPYLINGKIDRIDTNDDFFRILDYKSGNMEFSDADILSGTQLQLPLYASLLSRKGKDCAGMYYFHIANPISANGSAAYRLSGITTKSAVDDTDSEISEGKSSTVIRAKTLKSGQYAKFSQIGNIDSEIKMAWITALKTISGINEGKYPAYPLYLQNRKTVCNQCLYHGLCHFDLGKDKVRTKVKTN